MKFFGLFVTIICLHLHFPGMSQTVSFSGKDVPLQEIFAVIKTQTGIVFFYDLALVRSVKPITVRWKKLSVQHALYEICNKNSLDWILEDKTATITRKGRNSGEVLTNQSVASSSSPPPPIRVKGTITDKQGNPISSVSVVIKGTNRGVSSDSAGIFSIQAYEKNVLAFTSVNYSPKEVKVENAEMNIQLELDVKPMEALLVGGNLNAIKRKKDATSVTVLDAKTLERIPSNTLDQIFRGWVPGTNSFDPGDEPGGIPTLSIRGAGSAGSLATVAVYIDGIEYAGGSGYLSQLDKSNIDRIEIVRGPGAATMYGTGSNGGIVQIFTKKGRSNQSSVSFTTSAGFYKSKWVEKNPLQQLHNIEAITPFKNGTLKLGGSYRTIDAYLPDGGEKNTGLYASASFKFGKLTANFLERYNSRNFHLSRNPYFDTATHSRTDIVIEPTTGLYVPAYQWLGVMPMASQNKDGITQTYVGGINLSHRTSRNWVNNLDAGYTKNSDNQVPIQNGTTPLQPQYLADQFKISTIRYSNVLTFDNESKNITASISSGVEYKKYKCASSTTTSSTLTTTVLSSDPDNENFGAFVQANPSYKNLHFTLGLRYEKNNLFQATWNPRLGLTTNFSTRELIIKPRISWGKGISAPSYEQRYGWPPTLGSIIYPNTDLKPQSQQGFDLGLEVYDKSGRYKIEAVYYDNILQDMIAKESLGYDPTDPRLMAFVYSNVGEVCNKGWELSGEYQLGRFGLKGSYSIMNSIVKDTSGTYHSDLFQGFKPGSRMFNLPSHTAGVDVYYNFYKLFREADKGMVSFNLTELDGVMIYDYKSYAVDVSYGRAAFSRDYAGYPTENPPVFRLGVYADYFIASYLRFFVQGSNILNDYRYELSSDYPTHGATWLFGLKYDYSKTKKFKS